MNYEQGVQMIHVHPMQQMKMLEYHSLKLFCGTFDCTKKYYIDLFRKYAAVLVLLAAAHVYTLADIAAIIWQQLQYSRLHRVLSSWKCFRSDSGSFYSDLSH